LRKFLHVFELRLALLAVVALVVAQLGATAHTYSHGAASLASHQSGAVSHDPCNDCLAYAPLLSAAATPGPLPSLEPQGHGVGPLATANSLVELPPALAFRPRAPPVRA
jgi:hypothetical protein